jgi:serine/threonine-protein kinase
MGVVLDAVDETLGRRVAVKVVPRSGSSAADADRLLREARTGAALESPHATRIFEAGHLATGEIYVVMERLTGETLEQRLERAGPLPASVATDFALQALDAIGEAHRRGLVHRDLKPANLFVTRTADGHEHIKVLDFGLVRDTNATGSLTESGEGLGTPAYMPPEQIRAAKEVDARADVWSFGATLYEMLTGRLPFEAPNVPAMLTRILVQPCTPLASLRSDVPPALGAVVMRCLEKEPAARYGGGDELARALRDLHAALPAGAPVAVGTARVASPAPRPRDSGSLVFWRVLAVTLVVGAVAALMIAGAFAWTRGPRAAATIDAVAPQDPASALPTAEGDAARDDRASASDGGDQGDAASPSPRLSLRAKASGVATKPKVCACRSKSGQLLCDPAFDCRCVSVDGHELSQSIDGTDVHYSDPRATCVGYGPRNGRTNAGPRLNGKLSCSNKCVLERKRVEGEKCAGLLPYHGPRIGGTVTCE